MSRANRLKLAEAHRLNMWLTSNNLEALEDTTAAGIALEATKALGFVVTSANVAAAAEAVGKPLPRSRRMLKADAAAIFAAALLALYNHLERTPPPELVALTQERIES